MIETATIEGRKDYTGVQLRSHFIREASGIDTDGFIAFRGACEVRGEDLVDLEDAEEGSVIIAADMLHFIGEHFQCPLREAAYRLRLLAAMAAEVLGELVPGTVAARKGDDLFVGERKLTVAIATVSPVSALFHFGVNIDPAGAPVPAIGLEEIGADPAEFTARLLERYAGEVASVERAVRKVRGTD